MLSCVTQTCQQERHRAAVRSRWFPSCAVSCALPFGSTHEIGCASLDALYMGIARISWRPHTYTCQAERRNGTICQTAHRNHWYYVCVRAL